MSDDTRSALGIPKVVNTALGAVKVRTLSASEFIVLTEQLVGLGTIVRKESAKDGDFYGAMQRVLAKYPTAITGLLTGATGKTADELGGLPLDEFLDIGMAFMDQHEKSIARFFDLKRRWEDLTAKNRPSPSSSMRSSAEAGPSPTSAPSASSNWSSTEGSPLFDHSANESS